MPPLSVIDTTMVYTVLSSRMGDIMGRVIFQNISHSVAPSTRPDSYREAEMPCSPARAMIICTPDFHMTMVIRLKNSRI